MLKLENLSVLVKDKELCHNLNLEIGDGEVHILMGKNGIGKSSIAKSIVGYPEYEVSGNIIYNDTLLNKLDISKRALLGIYEINQTPIEIEGVTNAEMLRMAVSERSEETLNIFEFNKELENICEKLELPKSFIHKEINVGASGGEKKKIELLHMWMLKPKFIILDEIDSGLDVDAIKIVIKSLKEYRKLYNPSILIITHSNSIIKEFDDAYTHVLLDKDTLINGDISLANKILSDGFKANIISESGKNE